MRYGKGAVLGLPSKDRICFSDKGDFCLSELKFLSVIKGADL